VPAAVSAGGAARVADRPDPGGARCFLRQLRRQPGARRARARARGPGRPQRGRDADAARRVAGRNGARKWRGGPGGPTAEDLVDRVFRREQPNQLWLTDITEHPTREGKVYCAVVLDAFSRRVVGWSISHNSTAGLTCNALGMTIEQRDASRGTVIHSDHGTQFTAWTFSDRAQVGAAPVDGLRR
jgi:transposase InsO family protein